MHGTLTNLRCLKCNHLEPFSRSFLESCSNGVNPDCPSCERESRNVGDHRKSKRLAVKIGKLIPDIILYGQNHPEGRLAFYLGDTIAELQNIDIREKPDLFIVMGTSMKVEAIKVVFNYFSEISSRVLFFDTKHPSALCRNSIDVHLKTDVDISIKRLMRLMKCYCFICDKFFIGYSISSQQVSSWS